MADTSTAQLEKLEAEHAKRIAALRDIEAQLSALRAANRDAKRAELKKQIADYGFTADEKDRLCAKIHSHCMFAIAEYRTTTYSYMYPAPKPAPQVKEDYFDLIPGLELDFS